MRTYVSGLMNAHASGEPAQTHMYQQNKSRLETTPCHRGNVTGGDGFSQSNRGVDDRRGTNLCWRGRIDLVVDHAGACVVGARGWGNSCVTRYTVLLPQPSCLCRHFVCVRRPAAKRRNIESVSCFRWCARRVCTRRSLLPMSLVACGRIATLAVWPRAHRLQPRSLPWHSLGL